MELKILSPKHGEFIVLIDDTDYELITGITWGITKDKDRYYVRGKGEKTNGKTVKMHRLILNAPRGLQVDHINHNCVDNRRINLRLSTQRQNSKNQKLRKDSKTGFKGVAYSKKLQMYRCIITVDYKRIFAGYFMSPFDAARKYNELAIIHHKEFACLNVINEKDEIVYKNQLIHRIGINQKNNTTGYKGVFIEKRHVGKNYYAKISVNKKQKLLGYYETAQEAAYAYNEAAKEYFGDTAILNYLSENEVKIIKDKPLIITSGKYSTNTTGYKGVCRLKQPLKKPYVAQIRVNKKTIHLGLYETAELAALAYNEAVIKYIGTNAYLNKIPNE